VTRTQRWAIITAALVGTTIGLGLFTFGYARGSSYLTSEIAEQVKRDSTVASVCLARGHQRAAQFLVDFIEAENSMGFHAPQEAARILAKSIDQSRRGQAALRRP